MGGRWIAGLCLVVFGAADAAWATLDAASLAPNAPLSAAVGITIASPVDTSDKLLAVGDWDGREDLVADHEKLLFNDFFYPLAGSSVLMRAAFSPYSIANGGAFNLWYTATNDGTVYIGTEDPLGNSAPAFPLTIATGLGSTLNPIGGDAMSTNATVTGLAVQPVADMGIFGAGNCGVLGEIAYVSVEDHNGGSNDGGGHPIHTRVFALGLKESGSSLTFIGFLQIFRHRYDNVGGIAVDDSGSLYVSLVDLAGGTGGAIFKATETPQSACSKSNYTFRGISPFALDGNLDLTTAALDAPGVHLTNYSGASTTFGNVVALATGHADTLYAALARSKHPGDDAATAATEGLFENPAALGPTPSMVITFADAAGALDHCTSPGGMQPGILPIGDGVADVARADLTLTPGVNNFRAFVLGNGPDPRDGGPVFGSPATTLQLDMQIDWSQDGFGGITVDEENAVYVVSGGVPSGTGANPSPDRGEVLKFPDRTPFDRRADFIDLRGDTLPDPPDATGGPDGDSDRFDHVFFVAPNDSGGHPTGISGLTRGFLRYLNRHPPNAIPNLPTDVQGDDDANGPIDFNAFDPSEQVAGGDDSRPPNTGDDANGGFEFSFGSRSGSMCFTPATQFYLNSNGNLTFGNGDTQNQPDIPKLLSGPGRIAPLWTDLDSAARANGFPNQFPVQALGFAAPNAFKVRWIDVAPFGYEDCGGVATVSVTLYDDGTGDDESMPGTPEGPTATGSRPDGSGYFYFDYGRIDMLAYAGQPIVVGYARGADDLATPHVSESDWSQLAARNPTGVLGDPTKALEFELFKDGIKPAPQVDGKIDFDLRFASNDPALTTGATQPDPSRDTLAMHGIDCSATSLTCPYEMLIDPAAMAGGASYDQVLAVQGGQGPYTFAVSSGALPSGVALSTVTDAGTGATTGLISGGATQAGAFSVQVTATDANGCTVTAGYSFTATCIGGQSFASLACRLTDLNGVVGALPAGKVQKKLAKTLGKVANFLDGAQTKANAAQAKPEKRLLKKASGALKKFGNALKAKATKKALSSDQIADLSGRATSIKADVDALAATL